MSQFIQIDVAEVTNTCFVAMPFDSLFQAQYTKVIRPAIQEAGLACVRGDEIYGQAEIVADIWSSLRTARIVVAELSGRNPNVMYEVGLAHAIGKPSILLTREQDDVPFDLRALRYLYYDVNNPSWGSDLQAQLTEMIEMVLENTENHGHLAGITSTASLPPVPEGPAPTLRVTPHGNFAGVWSSSWESIRRRRIHEAHLVVPDHPREVTAYMTVRFKRNAELSVVHELMRGEALEESLRLDGVNYTYIERGASRMYHLDGLRLAYGGTQDTLEGRVVLHHGDVPVSFRRVPEGTERP